MKFFYTTLFMCFTMVALSQKKPTTNTDSLKNVQLDEVVISASNFNEKKKNIAQTIDVINAKTIALSQTQNTGDLLIQTGKVFVQKSQQGGSSPVIRGFEASRILLVVDGVRMNNAIYRSGHLQNIITVDQNSLSSVEVMNGAASTIYGSDALGGTIQLLTKNPTLSTTNNVLLKGTAFTRFSSANNEKTFHADISVGGKKIAFLQSFNYSDFGDMKMGNNYLSNYPNFGRRSLYIAQVNGIDTILKNSNDRKQVSSGYQQWDWLEKILFKQNDRITHTLNFQYSNSSNVPRYDRLQDTFTTGANRGLLRYADWFYGPQQRLLTVYELNAQKLGFIDEFKVNINYQNIKESRKQREYKRYDRFDSRVEKLNVFGATISARKLMKQHEIVVGVDMQLNDVKSTATRTNLLTNTSVPLDTRYPDGKNTMNFAGLFVQHLYKFNDTRFVLNDGIRLQYVQLKSNIVNNSFFNLPTTNITQNNVAVTGNIGLVFNATKTTTLRTALSTAFRAPNIDDLAKIFESSSTARQVVIPNANLKPEYTYNAEVSVAQQVGATVKIEATGFYTYFDNGIIKAPFQLNGQDSIVYNGVKSQVLASQNSNNATIYGATLNIQANVTKNVLAYAGISFTKGSFKIDENVQTTIYEKQTNGTYALVKRNVTSKPLDHIPPTFGKAGVQFLNKRINSDLFVLFNGWKRLDKYNPDGEDNAVYATKDGSPAWYTLNFKNTITINKYLQATVAVENIFDRNYRYFASGFSAAGRNFQIGLRANF